MEYDIIGGIHGHATKLVALLKKLGYHEQTGTWRHSDRTALFVGNFIGRRQMRNGLTQRSSGTAQKRAAP